MEALPAATTQFLQAGCPSCCPTNSVKALKAVLWELRYLLRNPNALVAISKGMHAVQLCTNKIHQFLIGGKMVAVRHQSCSQWHYLHHVHTICTCNASNNTHTHTHLTALCLGLPGSAGTRKVKPIWIVLKQETVSGSSISWAICKSAPSSRQITTPATHH